VLLHDHLDGGLRPATLIELAEVAGYQGLPVGGWAAGKEPERAAGAGQPGSGAPPGDLPRYLEAFTHTVAVMQTEPALVRVARECVQDLADDGVVYAEVRFAPLLHTKAGLAPAAVVEAVLAGLAAGTGDVRRPGPAPVVRALLTAMRDAPESLAVAQLAVRYRDAGVAGFDVAGPEAGYPLRRHVDAFALVRRASFHATAHAGEGAGLESVLEALAECGAERLGHGVRTVDDISFEGDGPPKLGRVAAYVRDRQVPLELCPTSNVQTGAAPTLATHPVELLRSLGFRVTVNTDNRLVSGVSLSSEMTACAHAFGWGWDEVQQLTVNAAESAFDDFTRRRELVNNVIRPGFAAIRGLAGGQPDKGPPAAAPGRLG
jgi:adenosine deaminase